MEGTWSAEGLRIGSDYGSDFGAQAGKSEQAGQLAVWDSKKLGKVETDSEGFTLHRFDKDTASPPKSNCEGDCAKTWPVVPAGKVTAAAGTDGALIGKVIRADGTRQLTIAGRPMYRYAKDTKPGDAMVREWRRVVRLCAGRQEGCVEHRRSERW